MTLLASPSPRVTLVLGLLGGLLLPAAPARADEFAQRKDLAGWVFSWGGYVHGSYSFVQQPDNYTLAGRNSGFQLQQARIGANVQYKDVVAMRVSLEGASEDRVDQSFPGGTFSARLRDAYLIWAPLRALRVSFGQMVVPFDLDSMRSDAFLPFVSRSVAIEGVQPYEGRALRGLGVDRGIGLALSSGYVPIGARGSTRYEVFVGNGNGQNQVLNDNNKPAVFGRIEFALWGESGLPPDQIAPMRSVTDLPERPILSVGAGFQYNPRTSGNPPDLIDETDLGGAFDVAFALKGIEVQGGLVYVHTNYDSVAAAAPREQAGIWGHLRYTIPKLPFDLIPGYRISNLAPRMHLFDKAPNPQADQADADLALLYHTVGVKARPVRSLPIWVSAEYTFTQERGPYVLKNDRFAADVVGVF